MIGVEVGSPFESAAGEFARIGGLDIAGAFHQLRSAVIENRGAPGNGLDLVAVGEYGGDAPVAPDQVGEEVIALFGIHAEGLAAIGCGSVELRKIQRAFAGVVEHGTGKQEAGAFSDGLGDHDLSLLFAETASVER